MTASPFLSWERRHRADARRARLARIAAARPWVLRIAGAVVLVAIVGLVAGGA